MAQIQITFDDSRDRNLSKLLGAYLENPANVFQSSRQESFYLGRQSPNETSYAVLLNDFNTLKKENEQTKNENSSLKEQVNSLRSTLQERDTQLEEKSKELKASEELLEEASRNLANKQKDLDNITASCAEEIKRVREDCESQKGYLNSRIQELRSQLEHYMPADITEANEIMHFMVVGDRLVETNATDAQYIGKAKKDGNIAFQFNREKGRPQDAISNKEKELVPFCEILECFADGNTIHWDQWGEGRLVYDILEVTTPAKIKIVRG